MEKIKKGWEYRLNSFIGYREVCNKNLWQMLLAEFLGVFLIVFLGLFSKVTTIEKFTPTIERQGLGWGLSVASMMLVVNHMSGGHLNPVVSFGLIFSGACSIIRGALYMVMHFLGGVAAGLVFKYCMPEDHTGEYSVLWHNHAVEPWNGFFVEMGATVPLLLLFASLKDQNRVDFRGSGALAVGMYHVAAHQCFWFYTGACLNPVRAFAPAFASNVWNHQWVYWLGPFAGAAIGGIVYPLLISLSKDVLEKQRNALKARQKEILDSELRDLFGSSNKVKKPPKPKPEPKKKPEKPAPPPVVTADEEDGGKKKKKRGAADEPAAEAPPAEDEDGGKKKKKKSVKNKDEE